MVDYNNLIRFQNISGIGNKCLMNCTYPFMLVGCTNKTFTPVISNRLALLIMSILIPELQHINNIIFHEVDKPMQPVGIGKSIISIYPKPIIGLNFGAYSLTSFRKVNRPFAIKNITILCRNTLT